MWLLPFNISHFTNCFFFYATNPFLGKKAGCNLPAYKTIHWGSHIPLLYGWTPAAIMITRTRCIRTNTCLIHSFLHILALGLKRELPCITLRLVVIHLIRKWLPMLNLYSAANKALRILPKDQISLYFSHLPSSPMLISFEPSQLA